MKKIYTLSLFLSLSLFLEAQIEGTWQIAPEAGALAVGPTLDDFSWWQSSADDISTRDCFFDDEFIFNADGTFENVQNGSTWLEAWQGVDADGCGAPIAPHDGSNSATWVDNGDGTVTVSGLGAHLGIAKAHNAGELTSPADAVAAITYSYVIDGDQMTVICDFGAGFWKYVFTRPGTIVVEPEPGDLAGTWNLAPQAGAMAVGPGNGDFSWWSNVEDDVTGRACLFDDEIVFNEDGTFENVFGDATWLEAWQGVEPDGCGAPIAPHDGSADAFWEDNGDGTFTLLGLGAHVGLAKVTNGGEITSPADATDSNTYSYTVSENTLTVEISFVDGVWKYIYEKAGNDTGGGPDVDEVAGAWKVSPQAAALAVGPELGDFSWWSNVEDDVATRACYFDDVFMFNADGTFENIHGDETWLEAWQGIEADGCGAPVAPHDGSAAATWVDNGDGTLTINGVGAYLGLPKVNNAGEIGSPGDAPASITYPYTFNGNTMVIDINFGAGWWHYVLVSADAPEIPSSIEHELVSNLVEFYPNPANDAINVFSEEVLDEISIINIVGQVVTTRTNPGKNVTIDISNLSSGVYLLESRKGNLISVEKLLVK